jgi:hypothetical protein
MRTTSKGNSPSECEPMRRVIPRTKAGFFDLSRCRLFPLEYRLPVRFDMIPLQAQPAGLGDEGSIGYQGVTEQDAVDAGDER